jgi:DNA-binding transcriptional regulator YdaS (Cro superfamily)
MRKKIYPAGIAAAIDAAGSLRKLATLLSIQHSAILKWKAVPAHRILEIEQKTGVPREILRPELYVRTAKR